MFTMNRSLLEFAIVIFLVTLLSDAFLHNIDVFKDQNFERKKSLTNFKIKVQLFWEGHKKLRNLPYGFDIYLVNVKTIGDAPDHL